MLRAGPLLRTLRSRPLVHRLRPWRRRLSSDPYAALGIPPTATRAEAKKAYLALAKQHHPDKSGDPRRFKAIAEAWEVVGDKAKRALHDEAVKPNAFRDAAAASQKRGESRSFVPLNALERLFGPSVVVAALVAAALYAFASVGGKAAPRDETLVQGCWVNPATGRLEPPAPWEEAYRAAKAAGRTRAAPRHAVGERR
jgi:curved DNA-binding protein CbpA